MGISTVGWLFRSLCAVCQASIRTAGQVWLVCRLGIFGKSVVHLGQAPAIAFKPERPPFKVDPLCSRDSID
jgi:hypothetical protein